MADVSRETEGRLRILEELVKRWSPVINLVSRADLDGIWERHVCNSLALAPYLPPVGSALDIGSGGGFPGLVLAIATGVAFTLVESDHRKAAFLREAIRATESPGSVLCQRVELLPPQAAGLITSRGFAPLPRLLDCAYPHLAAGGVLLILKGHSATAELDAVAPPWQMSVERFPTGDGGAILRIRDVTRA